MSIYRKMKNLFEHLPQAFYVSGSATFCKRINLRIFSRNETLTAQLLSQTNNMLKAEVYVYPSFDICSVLALETQGWKRSRTTAPVVLEFFSYLQIE